MYNQAISAHYPTLDVSVSASRLDEPVTFSMEGNAILYPGTPFESSAPIAMEVQTMGRDTVFSQVSTTLPLYTGGKISALVHQAEIAHKIAKEGRLRAKNEVIYDVKRYYYGVILTQQLKKLSQETLTRMSFIRDLTSRLYKGGSMNVKKTDYLRTKLSVNMIEVFNETIIKKETLAKSALIFAMGLSYKDKVTLTQESIKEPRLNENLEAIVQNAYDFNHDYKTLKLAINVHDSKLNEAKSDYLPSLGFRASAQNIYNDYDYGIINEQNKNSWTIGIGLEWSLFNGMRTTNKVEQSRLEKFKLEQQEIILQEGLALQVKQAFIEINSTYKQYEILKKAIETAKENRNLNIRAYQEDMVQTKDVLEAQLFESLTVADYYKSRYEHALARISVNYIVGEVIENSVK